MADPRAPVIEQTVHFAAPFVAFRALRHTAAATWLRAGIPLIVVSQALGRTGIAITARQNAVVAPVVHAFAVHRGTRSVPSFEIGGQAVNNR